MKYIVALLTLFTVACGSAVKGVQDIAQGTSYFTVQGNNTQDAYWINGATNPTLHFVRGQSYTFSVSSSGHPFWIVSQPGTNVTANAWAEGVTNNGTEAGVITFDVPGDAPAKLYYNASDDGLMSGMIEITNQ